jgi:hypothetical protein
MTVILWTVTKFSLLERWKHFDGVFFCHQQKGISNSDYFILSNIFKKSV